MLFRPCIDLHGGKVKQIVGSTLETGSLRENFVSEKPPEYYARLFASLGLSGGHVVMLGPGNTEAALSALRAYPGGMSVGGGISEKNAALFLENGASQVIVTSALFPNSRLDMARAAQLSKAIGPDKLIFDLSCVSSEDGCRIACDRWRTVTDDFLTTELLAALEPLCAEFLVHAVASEGKRAGADMRVAEILTDYASRPHPRPVTYAGGLSSAGDVSGFLLRTERKVCFTVGSALDIYGGSISLAELSLL